MTNGNEQLKSLLKTHSDPNDEILNQMWKHATFIFDSNVLLDLYRLPQPAKNELLSVLNNPEINSRIWIGFQGLLEFLNNRYDTIGDQKTKFDTVRTKLNQAIDSYNAAFRTLNIELAKLKLHQRHSLINPEKYINPENISSGISFIRDFLENLTELEVNQRDVHDQDETKKHVLDLFNGKVGYGFNKDEVKKIYTDGEERYKNNVPPGYEDKSKGHSYTVLDIEYKCKFGDLLFWKEVIRKAQKDKLEYVILVTGDVKEDWWLEKRGKKLGPRKELLNEIYTAAPALKHFHMYDTSNFLRRVTERLTVNVSESTISETENLLIVSREATKAEHVSIPFIVELISVIFDEISVGRTQEFADMPTVMASGASIYDCFFEIFQNAKYHATSKSLHIDSRTDKHYRTIRISNPYSETKNMSAAPFSESSRGHYYERGTGLEMIRRKFANEDIHVETTADGKAFTVEIAIPLSKFGKSEL